MPSRTVPATAYGDPHQKPPTHSTDLRTLVLTELAHLRTQANNLADLIDTRRPTTGYLTVEAAKAQDDLLRTERTDRARHAREGTIPTAVVAAPGSISAFSLRSEWHALLADTERSIATRLLRAGICHTSSRPTTNTSTDQLCDRVEELLAVTTRPTYLERLHRDLVDLSTRITRFVEAAQIKALPDPCPWCGHLTLVADITNGVITCGPDRDTGITQWCICSDSYCDCQTASWTYRHTWHRDHKAHKGTSWQGLRRAINATNEETR